MNLIFVLLIFSMFTIVSINCSLDGGVPRGKLLNPNQNNIEGFGNSNLRHEGVHLTTRAPEGQDQPNFNQAQPQPFPNYNQQQQFPNNNYNPQQYPSSAQTPTFPNQGMQQQLPNQGMQPQLPNQGSPAQFQNPVPPQQQNSFAPLPNTQMQPLAPVIPQQQLSTQIPNTSQMPSNSMPLQPSPSSNFRPQESGYIPSQPLNQNPSTGSRPIEQPPNGYGSQPSLYQQQTPVNTPTPYYTPSFNENVPFRQNLGPYSPPNPYGYNSNVVPYSGLGNTPIDPYTTALYNALPQILRSPYGLHALENMLFLLSNTYNNRGQIDPYSRLPIIGGHSVFGDIAGKIPAFVDLAKDALHAKSKFVSGLVKGIPIVEPVVNGGASVANGFMGLIDNLIGRGSTPNNEVPRNY